METIYITNTKKSLLYNLGQVSSLTPYKVYTPKEFLQTFPYSYTEKALDFIISEEQVILEVAEKYLDNILLFPLEKINNEKGIYLKNLKEKLIENNLLTENRLLKEKYKNVIFKIDEYVCSKELLQLLKGYHIEIIPNNKNTFEPKVYILNTIEEEIAFVFEKIILLLQKGISPQNIYVTNVSEEYLDTLKRVAKQMHVLLNLPAETTLFETRIGSFFCKNLSLGIPESLNKTSEILKNADDKDIYNEIVTITNKYLLFNNKEAFIKRDLKRKTLKIPTYKNGLKIVNFKNQLFKENDYLFFLSCNSDSIPKFYKDEDYFNDAVKKEIGFDTATDKNKREKKYMTDFLTSYPNLTLTLKRNNLKKEVYPSSLLENLKIQEGVLSYNISSEYNEYILGKLMDNFTKFGTIDDTFTKLSSNYLIAYQTYQNEYQKIDKEKLYKFLKNKISLSYTKMKDFLACPFSYYLKYILKLSPYEETFNTVIGTIFHKILERKDEEEFDYDYVFEKTTQDYDFSPKEKMILGNLKEEFRNTLNLLQEREKFTELKEKEFEKEINFSIKDKLDISFDGKIDAIYYNEENKIFKIIDYKSGMPFLDASIMPHGFSLQLPCYLYLLKKDENFKDYTCGGFYLQPLFIDKQKCENKVDYEITKKKALKAVGYSTSNLNILGMVDSSYPNSCQIKSMKTTQSGNFYTYTKVFNQEDLDTLFNLINNLIKDTVKKVIDADFKIEPKILDNKENISCQFCPFKDICFTKDKDKIYINSDKKFLKKEVESNGLDE